MNVDIVPFAVVWALLASVVLALIVYRYSVSRHEDDTLHVLGANVATEQTSVAHKLEVIDRWGKILTAITVLYGLAMVAAFLYLSWVQGSTTLG
jgi:hypothetical protein